MKSTCQKARVFAPPKSSISPICQYCIMTDPFDTQLHQKFMRRCIDLAKRGINAAMPNPLVGAVLVYNERIIGEGWHQAYGKPHAEPNAISKVPSHLRHLLPKAVLYVNLEPCNHYGKTPPCTQTIIKNGIKTVVLGCLDPNPKVAGSGIAALRAAGVNVIAGIEEKKCHYLNRRFFAWMQQKRPYVLLKWAQTPNGYFAPQNGKQQWISNRLSKRLSHRFRTQEQAILVGTNTARIDNPQLTARLWHGNQPLRLVIDRKGELPKNLHLFDQRHPTVVFAEQTQPDVENLLHVQLDFKDKLPAQILQYLCQQNIQSLMVEGGARLLNGFIQNNLWDEVRVYTGAKAWDDGMPVPQLPNAKLHVSLPLGNNVMRIYHRQQIKSP